MEQKQIKRIKDNLNTLKHTTIETIAILSENDLQLLQIKGILRYMKGYYSIIDATDYIKKKIQKEGFFKGFIYHADKVGYVIAKGIE
jgi:hypothetical protein